MKKLVFAVIAAAVSLGAALPASAWGYQHCVTAANLGASSGTLANHCGKFVPSKGIISFGKHENETWAEAFPNAKLGSEVEYISQHRINGTEADYTWKLFSNADALRTKIIKLKDWDAYKQRVDFTIDDAKVIKGY